MTARAPLFPFALDPLMAESRRRMRKRRVVIAVLAVLIVGGAAGAAVAFYPSRGFRAAAPCPGAGARVYAVPSNPAHPSTAPAWPPGANDDWGWMVRRHALNVGDRIHLSVNGPLWQVTAIGALPGDCKPFIVMPPFGSRLAGGSLAGRLILQQVR